MEEENIFNEDDEELEDVEVLEFGLDDEEIDELIEKLNNLKKTKESFEFDIDGNNELLIKYEQLEEGEESE
ncbi:MAG: hypothetical protein KKF48_03860 [Nanoarchaeota archaeon]|nr:hypothetical protein [Nanoarchaeota archaeon]MBU1028153.1 hypothetical protein [Nanoarchaeota archaeon]